MKLFILIYLSVVQLSVLNAFEEPKYRLTLKFHDINESLKFCRDNDLDVAGVNIPEKYVDILASETELKKIETKGLSYQILEVKGISKAIDEEYKNPTEVEELLKKYNQDFPELTQLISIGSSVEGRNIWALKISDNAKVDEDEPSILFNSMHHAREIMTPEITLDLIDYLLKNYNLSTEVKNWVDDNEIWVVPMLNVDGNHKVWTEDSWWRKNVSNGHGVDINRNYPAFWGTCNGSSGYPDSQTYRGPHAGSEPETQALMNLVASIRPVFNISYHAYSEIVIYPYGCSGNRTPNKEVVEGIGAEIGKKLNYKPGTSWELLYSVDGGDVDWMYQAYQVIPYVIEVNSSRDGFHPNYARMRNVTVEKNRNGWQHLLRRLNESGVRGTISTNSKLENLNILVYKGSQLFQNYKLNPDNSFHIVLNPGEYELQLVRENQVLKSKKINLGKNRMELEF
jgi:carboxypeptidase T